MSENLLRVQPIRNGTVIDHIKSRRGRKILDVLNLSESGTTISLLMNVPSKKQNRKDIIKVEDRELSEDEIEKLALLSPKARVNIIRNYAVADKKMVEILWASTREPYNYTQAQQLGCQIITMPPKVIEKVSKFGKSFDQLTKDTVKAFLADSKKSRFSL